MTEKQLQLLSFIRNKIVHVGHGPTYKEMCEYMGVSSNQTIEDFLLALVREGYIEKNKGKLRGLSLTSKGIGFDKTVFFGKNEVDTPDSSAYIPSSAATSFSQYIPFANGVITQPNGFIPWKGGEKNGTT